jgi:hypothetical protein
VDEANVVAVCGAGAAGMAAALTAARAGAQVVLIEAQPDAGGTVTGALIHTLGGFFDSSGAFLNEGLASHLVETLMRADSTVRRRRLGRTWVLNVDPDVYAAAVRSWLAAQRRLVVLYRTRVTEVVRQGNRVVALNAVGPEGPVDVRTKAVIDTTGTAEVVRLLDPALVDDGRERMAGGLIFVVRNVAAGALAFPKGLGVVRALRTAAADGNLPVACDKAWVDSGVRDDEVYVKLFVPLPLDWRQREEHIMQEAHETQAAVVAFLKRLPDFAAARVARTGRLGVREGGRVRGVYCLTAADVRQGRRFEDAACRCAWPIEYWHPRDGVTVEYLPEQGYYEIPLCALRVAGWANVWAAGKCLSADAYAQASARVVGSCWSMGEAVAKAACGLTVPQGAAPQPATRSAE